jgi:hypothetical protein
MSIAEVKIDGTISRPFMISELFENLSYPCTSRTALQYSIFQDFLGSCESIFEGRYVNNAKSFKTQKLEAKVLRTGK